MKASAEDSEGEVTLNKPMGSGKKVTSTQRAANRACGDPCGPIAMVLLVKVLFLTRYGFEVKYVDLVYIVVVIECGFLRQMELCFSLYFCSYSLQSSLL